MSTCNRLDLDSLGSWPTLYAQKLTSQALLRNFCHSGYLPRLDCKLNLVHTLLHHDIEAPGPGLWTIFWSYHFNWGELVTPPIQCMWCVRLAFAIMKYTHMAYRLRKTEWACGTHGTNGRPLRDYFRVFPRVAIKSKGKSGRPVTGNHPHVTWHFTPLSKSDFVSLLYFRRGSWRRAARPPDRQTDRQRKLSYSSLPSVSCCCCYLSGVIIGRTTGS